MLGFYGKLPCLGDFVSRGLAKDFVQPWDKWLQDSLANSREQLAETWVDSYLVSPIWHFMLSANLCGTSSWMGLMMPSVDKVGRYFPLTLALKLPSQIAVSSLTDGAITHWFAQADNLALSTLEEPFDLAQFEQKVAKFDVPLTRNAKPHQTAWYVPLHDDDEFAAHCQSVEENGIRANYSLWWTGDTEYFQRAFIFCEGLPPHSGFSAFLDGDWQRWGWQLKNV
jgi:type VI secretion system protein ImpM